MLNKDPNLKVLSFCLLDESEEELWSLSILPSHLGTVAALD